MGPARGRDLSVRSTEQAPVGEEAEGQCQTGAGLLVAAGAGLGLGLPVLPVTLFLKAHGVLLRITCLLLLRGLHPAEGGNRR